MRGVERAREGARGSRPRIPGGRVSPDGGEHFVRAAIYYHFAKFVFVQDAKQMSAAHMKAVDCYRSALDLMRPPGVYV